MAAAAFMGVQRAASPTATATRRALILHEKSPRSPCCLQLQTHALGSRFQYFLLPEEHTAAVPLPRKTHVGLLYAKLRSGSPGWDSPTQLRHKQAGRPAAAPQHTAARRASAPRRSRRGKRHRPAALPPARSWQIPAPPGPALTEDALHDAEGAVEPVGHARHGGREAGEGHRRLPSAPQPPTPARQPSAGTADFRPPPSPPPLPLRAAAAMAARSEPAFSSRPSLLLLPRPLAGPPS